jgi:hypothetical protein
MGKLKHQPKQCIVMKLLVSLTRQYASNEADTYILKNNWFAKLTSSMEMATQQGANGSFVS